MTMLTCFVVALVACTSTSEESTDTVAPVVLTYGQVKSADAMGAEGTLGVDGGCIVLQTPEGGQLRTTWGLLWPDGVTVSPSSSNAGWTVMTSDGKAAGETGAKITIGGTPFDAEGAQRMVIGGIPPACAARRYFAVANVRAP
jgi:hypothetical protein